MTWWFSSQLAQSNGLLVFTPGPFPVVVANPDNVLFVSDPKYFSPLWTSHVYNKSRKYQRGMSETKMALDGCKGLPYHYVAPVLFWLSALVKICEWNLGNSILKVAASPAVSYSRDTKWLKRR